MTVADPGSTIYITMNGTTVVPKDILTLAADKQLTLVLDMGNGSHGRLTEAALTQAL